MFMKNREEPNKQEYKECWRKWTTYFPVVSFVSGTVGYIAVNSWKEWARKILPPRGGNLC